MCSLARRHAHVSQNDQTTRAQTTVRCTYGNRTPTTASEPSSDMCTKCTSNGKLIPAKIVRTSAPYARWPLPSSTPPGTEAYKLTDTHTCVHIDLSSTRTVDCVLARRMKMKLLQNIPARRAAPSQCSATNTLRRTRTWHHRATVLDPSPRQTAQPAHGRRAMTTSLRSASNALHRTAPCSLDGSFWQSPAHCAARERAIGTIYAAASASAP